jgi:hypothetical protein
MKRLRFNTVANWSEWKISKAAGFPYVRPMDFEAKWSGWTTVIPGRVPPSLKWTPSISARLSSTATDPAFIGYFR